MLRDYHTIITQLIQNLPFINSIAVIEGDHIIYLSYLGNKGEQKINLEGDKREYMITIQVIIDNPILKPMNIILIGTLLLIIGFLLWKRKRKS